jgi:ketosteroid isomerase-like protein
MRDTYGAGAEASELVQRLFEAFNRRDIETALTLLHTDVVFEPVSAVVLNDGKPYVGHDGIRLYFEHVSKHWRKLEVKPIQIRAAGVAVVALGQTSGEGAGGALVAAPTTWLFKFRDDLIAELQIFSDERLAKRALAAAEKPQDPSSALGNQAISRLGRRSRP